MSAAQGLVEAELRLALERQQFLVYYQPKASCRSGAVTGFEALLRWRHPTRGIVAPAEFVPLLEQAGLIQSVGAWVLRSACQQLKVWIEAGHSTLQMAVNLSMRQLEDADFPEQVGRILSELEVPANQLELELTESMLMHDLVQTEALLHRLKDLGVRLSIDDFGTGYSCLSYLKRLPIDTLKVDRSFVQDITTDPNDASITRAIIGMAHSLKMTVVAEGVETDAQLATLVAEHCETVQGYFLSKPLPGERATAFLASGWRIPSALLGRPAKERTLLLVDDEDSIVSALKRLLRREDYRILSANSGAQGLELLAKNDVDVVLSDQRMPEMTGEEFLRRTKELYPSTVRIVLSGYADMQSITRAINQGAIYKFMSKPWDEKTLKEGIQEAFRRKERIDVRQRHLQDIAAANDTLHKDKQSLALLLDAQSHTAMVSQAALQIAQENLYQLPLPVIGMDPSGLVVLRNEAFYALALPPDACLELVAQFPVPCNEQPFTLAYQDPAGAGWRILARHLVNAGQHRGTVLAFIAEEPPHAT
jgi:EAL domain-containing protein (putative c-di-GMP-specific phosphodiesterase class I)/FixJ family two-component response regulator